MMAAMTVLVGLGLVTAGVAGSWFGFDTVAGYAWPLLLAGVAILAASALKLTYHRRGSSWPQSSGEPRPLQLTWRHYLQALVGWLNAFKRTYAVEPGLYYTGQRYDDDAPLLVTSNYLLTVFLVWRRIRGLNTRLLVVDTDGINVWCAAGKGTFSGEGILAQVDRYRGVLGQQRWLTMILPKFGMAGVDLRQLRKNGIRPIIGPLYARDLPAYLGAPPLKDRDLDTVAFDGRSRIFSWLPGMLQFLAYSLALLLVFMGLNLLWGVTVPACVVCITALVATVYPLAFPLLPGRRFAVKGLSLATVVSAGLGAMALTGALPAGYLVSGVLFTYATALFFGLSYTGNSAVSNYTRIRRETAHFLPADVLLYVASLAAFIYTEVNR